MSKSKEKGFTFKINMGERIKILMTETEIDRTCWMQSLKLSMVTAKEMSIGTV